MKMSFRRRVLAFLSSLLVAACILTMLWTPLALAGAWQIQTVDSAGDTGRYSSLALDASGNPCISYYDEADTDLKFARSDDWGATWNIGTVASEGALPSLALDASGNPCISYYDGVLKFARSNDGGATWPTIVTVDSTGEVGIGCSLALDAGGNPCISYYDNTNTNLKFARSNDHGNTWPTIVTVAPAGASTEDTSVALDACGNPCISYYDSGQGDLKFARSNDGGTTWPTIVTVDSTGNVGQYNSLALDAGGNPCIGYYENNGLLGGRLKFSRSNDGGTTWPSIVTVDSAGNVGRYPSLAFDTYGNPHVSYYDWTGHGDLKYASSNDGGASWPAGNIEVVDSAGDVGMWTSLALDAGNNPHISYYDVTNFDLKYAYKPYPLPTITSISPNSRSAGDTGFTLTVNGNGFSPASIVKWNGTGRTTTFVSPTQLTTSIPSSDIADVGISEVSVFNPAPGGGQSSSLSFTSLSTYYLAEGTNAWGFSTYITLENPNDSSVTATLTYMNLSASASGKGIAGTRTLTLPPLSQTCVSSVPDIGNVDFSTKVECTEGKTIAVDRTMYWTGPGYSPSQSGYHSSIGVTSPSTTWYLPEGSSNWGFETWTLVENPNPTAANVTLTYMTEGGGAKPLTKTIPPYSRATYSMSQDIGGADSSIQVTSDIPVIAERSVYRNNKREGSCSIGATSPSTDFFLAEGATGYNVGYVTYVLVQNPQNTPTDVSLTYQTQGGQVAGPSFTMGPNSRKTIRLNDQLPANTNVSTQVHGSQGIIAERAMYWDNGTGQAFHASIGLSSPHLSFYLPDGNVSPTSETWTLVENPNPGAVTVRITYLPNGGGTPISFTDEIPPGTRATYNMAAKIPSGRASIMVQSLDGGRPIMVERSMYMNNRGGGTDTIGGWSDTTD
jgi:Family of unknown function (DUF5719)